MTICVVGDLADLTAAYVRWRAESAGIEVLALGESRLGLEWAFGYDDLSPGNGLLEYRGRRRQLHEIDGTFVRLAARPGLPRGLSLSAGQRAVALTERRASLQHLLESLPGPVANPPSAAAGHASRPWQLAQLAAAGFDVPRWMVSSDVAAVWTFVGHCPNGAVYRPAGARVVGRRLDEAALRTMRTRKSPILVQENVIGRDLRVHVVGECCFAAEKARDEAFHPCLAGDLRPAEAAASIEPLCVAFAQVHGLMLAAFDFRVTEDGRWCCLSMDPWPAFVPYEMGTGHGIADALIERLTRQTPRRALRAVAAAR